MSHIIPLCLWVQSGRLLGRPRQASQEMVLGPRALWEIPGDSEGTLWLFKCLQNNGCYVTAVSFKELEGEEKKAGSGEQRIT